MLKWLTTSPISVTYWLTDTRLRDNSDVQYIYIYTSRSSYAFSHNVTGFTSGPWRPLLLSFARSHGSSTTRSWYKQSILTDRSGRRVDRSVIVPRLHELLSVCGVADLIRTKWALVTWIPTQSSSTSSKTIMFILMETLVILEIVLGFAVSISERKYCSNGS